MMSWEPCRPVESDYDAERCELCPARREGVMCWEFDWPSYVRRVENPTILEVWREYIRNHCLQCPVYMDHKDVMEPMFIEIGAIIVPKEVEVKKEKNLGLFSFVSQDGQ